MSDLKTFVVDTREFKTTGGETLVVKPLLFGQELELCALVGDTMKAIKFDSLSAAKSGMDFLSLLPDFFTQSPQALVKATEIITGKPGDWLKKNLTLDLTLEIVTPFFVNLYQVIKARTGNVFQSPKVNA
jgi:hypothetical protein